MSLGASSGTYVGVNFVTGTIVRHIRRKIKWVLVLLFNESGLREYSLYPAHYRKGNSKDNNSNFIPQVLIDTVTKIDHNRSGNRKRQMTIILKFKR